MPPGIFMKIKNRLLLIILPLSLLPLVIIGIFSYLSARNDLTRTILDHLKSVASIQQSRIKASLDQNRERLALVSSRTQLRISLDHYIHNKDKKEIERMNRILADAGRSIEDIIAITLYDNSGTAVASTVPENIGKAHHEPAFFKACQHESAVDEFFLDPENKLFVYLSGPVVLNGELLGVILIKSKVQNLLFSITDYSGLGNTGETILVKPDGVSGAIFLAPTRFTPDAALVPVPNNESGTASLRILNNELVHDDVLDYRGVSVFAYGRPIPKTDWAVVVKIDREEVFSDLRNLAILSFIMVIALSIAVLIIAVRLARGMSLPLVELSEAAGEIANGEYGRKVKIRSRDEIGALEKSFNEMSVKLREARSQLEHKVNELHTEIMERKIVEAEKERLIAELRSAVNEIKTLKGIIPICSSCKKIRDDKGYWKQLEVYIRDHSDAEFSHGFCPECLAKYESDLF
jgi:HAMP domain-containing protein